MKQDVLCVFGTRPEAIKMAPVIAELAASCVLRPVVCVTGQHREMLDQVLRLFGIVPDYDLGIMRHGQDLTDITTGVLAGMRDVLRKSRPACVLVHGDTTTALAASVASYYERVPLGHVEAGLRTGNIRSPWPEEVNRRIAGVIADFHFAPTSETRQNLLAEGVPSSRVWVTGNTVIDALLAVVERLRIGGDLRRETESRFSFLDERKRLILVTGHRRESFGGGHARVCRALGTLAERGDVQIVYPVHLNPRVKDVVESELRDTESVHLIPPQDYVSFVYLMERSYLVASDSGGIQEEAPSLGKPVLVLRDTTERPEAIASGTAKLVGTETDKIVFAASELLDNADVYESMSKAPNPYGDGAAASRIVRMLEGQLQ